MLNTRASIDKAFAGAGLVGVQLLLDDYQALQLGTGPYPSLAVRILDAGAPVDQHLGQRTPRSPAGAERYTLVIEGEVRTNSPTWNEAIGYADQLRAVFDKTTFARQTWLLDPKTANPTPTTAGFIRFNRATLTTLQDESQPDYKSAFLTWEAQVEVPIA